MLFLKRRRWSPPPLNQDKVLAIPTRLDICRRHGPLFTHLLQALTSQPPPSPPAPSSHRIEPQGFNIKASAAGRGRCDRRGSDGRGQQLGEPPRTAVAWSPGQQRRRRSRRQGLAPRTPVSRIVTRPPVQHAGGHALHSEYHGYRHAGARLRHLLRRVSTERMCVGTLALYYSQAPLCSSTVCAKLLLVAQTFHLTTAHDGRRSSRCPSLA